MMDGFVLIKCVFAVYISLWSFTEGSLSSGLSRFGLSQLQNEPCHEDTSDPHACYHIEKTNISCLTAVLRFDKCKTQTHAVNSDGGPGNGHIGNWTVLQAYYQRHQGQRPRQELFEGTCMDMTPGNCSQYRCVKECCRGWDEDESGRCLRRSWYNQCRNGGTYDHRLQVCMCQQGFSGRNCEIALCPGGCKNGGRCLPNPLKKGENYCECPQLTYGPQCEHVKRCDEECQNGGTCVADGPDPVCVCLPEFFGKTCSRRVYDDDTCPPPNTTVCTDLASCQDRCETSRDCREGKVCCTDGCCMGCVRPRSPGCFYKGIMHKPREYFRDGCDTCVCRTNGEVSCRNRTCAVPSSCQNVDYSRDACCGRCTDGRPDYHKPPSVNCTGNIETLYASDFSLSAEMKNLNIRAYDENGIALKVYYNPWRIVHCQCSLVNRDVSVVKVSATDSRGQTSDCEQRVFVADRTPPSFILCPTDRHVTEGETVSWREPIASDNVGVWRLNRNYNPNKPFPVGTTTVLYIATDYDNNRAFCKFSVHVAAIEYGSGTHTDRETPDRQSYSGLIGGVTGTVVIIIMILVGVVVYRYCRLKHKLRRQPTNYRTPIPTISNVIYDSTVEEFVRPAEGATLKPPPYSPPSEPPAYDEVVWYENGAAEVHLPDSQPPEYEYIRRTEAR